MFIKNFSRFQKMNPEKLKLFSAVRNYVKTSNKYFSCLSCHIGKYQHW